MYDASFVIYHVCVNYSSVDMVLQPRNNIFFSVVRISGPEVGGFLTQSKSDIDLWLSHQDF